MTYYRLFLMPAGPADTIKHNIALMIHIKQHFATNMRKNVYHMVTLGHEKIIVFKKDFLDYKFYMVFVKI
jgi:hypothetical protein